MNRKDVEKVLNEFIAVGHRHVRSLDAFYEEFEEWNLNVLESIKLHQTGKKGVLSVPPTPHVRRRLSTIGECPGGEGQGDSRASRTSKTSGPTVIITSASGRRTKKVGNSNNKGISDKSSPRHRLKRAKLSYEDEDEDDDETINDTTGNTVRNSQNNSVNVQGLSLQSEQENNVCEVIEGRKGGARGRRTKQTSFLARKAPPCRRTTRSNARITRSTNRETLNDCDGDSMNVITQSVSKPPEENDENGSIDQRGRRTKQSCIVRKGQRVTSARASRSESRLTDRVNHATLIDAADSQNAITETSDSKIEQEDIQERRVSNNDNERNPSRRTRSIHVIVDDISQDSLNVIPVTSRSSTSRSSKGNSNRIKEADVSMNERSNDNGRKSQNSNHKALNEISQDSLNVSAVISEIPTSVVLQDSSNANNIRYSSSSANKQKSVSSQGSCCKILTVCLTRLDACDIVSQSTVSEESIKKIAVENGRKSEGKRSIPIASTAEARKRNNSYVDNNCPSKKKSRSDKNVEEVEFVDRSENVQETSSLPKISGKRKSSRINRAKLMEVQSFNDISLLPSEVLVGKDNLFEELVKDLDRPHINEKIDSGKGNSDSGLENSEYYSLVDAGEITEDGKDAYSATQKKSASDGKDGPNPSVGKKQKETLYAIREQNTPTPERTITWKSGRSPALFSAYANEPVKNRVAAYEGLSTLTEEVQVPVTNKRVTRTKTRAMAAAAAAAAATAVAPSTGASQPKAPLNNSRKSGPSVKITRASWRKKKKVGNSVKRNDASKENSFQFNSSKNSNRDYKNISGTGGKILADINGLFSPGLNNSKKTPMTGPRIIPVNNLSASQITKSGYRPGTILTSCESFIKKPGLKPVQDSEIKKLEDMKKREEREREALRRREEFLKKQAEEKKKKMDEKRLRVQEKREAQEKEKQESQLRVEKEKDEKRHILQQEREAKQKGNVLKKKLETERKAAEARRKVEEAEAARIAKLKMEELQQKKEQEEAERERLRLIAEEKEATLQRERAEQRAKELAAKAKAAKAENQKKTVPVFKPPAKVVQPLNTTFTNTHDSTFTIQSSGTKNLDNAYNLEDLQSEDSEDEDELPKQTARWALKSELLQCSNLELQIFKLASKDFSAPEKINMAAIFPKKALKRTSSAIWNTPPRYSILPKY